MFQDKNKESSNRYNIRHKNQWQYDPEELQKVSFLWNAFPDQQILLEKSLEGFLGGSVVKNPPANAGDTGLILGLGRFPMTQNNSACVPQLLSLYSRAQELQLLKLVSPRAMLCNVRSHCNKKPSRGHEEQPLLATTREKPMEQQDPAQPKRNKCIKWNHKKRKTLRI